MTKTIAQDDKLEILHRLKRETYWLYLLLGLVIAAVVAIIHTNTPHTVPIFLFLYVILVGLSLILGRLRALLIWLATMFVWISLKRLFNVWTSNLLMENLVETVLLLAVAWIAGVYHDRRMGFWRQYAENMARQQAPQLEEAIGLLSSQVGMLRLEEEEERVFLYQRPLALLLLEVQVIPKATVDSREHLMALKAVATALKDAARDTDIPFRVTHARMGLILPETDMDSIQRILDHLILNLQDLRFVDVSGTARPVNNIAQMRYGYAVYLGHSTSRPDMMLAALHSLERSIQANHGPVFQNLFIEFEVLGNTPEQSAVLSIAENHRG